MGDLFGVCAFLVTDQFSGYSKKSAPMRLLAKRGYLTFSLGYQKNRLGKQGPGHPHFQLVNVGRTNKAFSRNLTNEMLNFFYFTVSETSAYYILSSHAHTTANLGRKAGLSISMKKN